MNTSISIITVVLNGSSTIADCLKSIASQTYPCEHIVINGGSTDGTLAVVRRFSHVACVVSEPDKGIYDAMNKGIALATGDVIGMLNSDDMYTDNEVLGKIAKIFDDPSVDACYADLIYVDKRDTDKVTRTWKSSKYKEGLFPKGWAPAHPTFFVRKHIYDKFGAFNLKYVLASDYELMLRFLERYRIRSVYLPEVIVKMRSGGVTNKSIANIVKQNIEIWQAAHGNGVKLSCVFLVHKLFNKIFQFI